MTTYNVYQDGRIVATYENNEKKTTKRTRAQRKQAKARRQRDARLLKALATK